MPPERGPTRIKICGLTDEAAMEAAAEAGADWVGFVFFPRSPRFVAPHRAAMLQQYVPASVGSVALLVQPDDDEIAAVLDTLSVCALQIYASTERCAFVRDRFGVPVWQALGIAVRDDLPRESGLDALVIESRPPPGADRPGGNGHGFDWGITREWTAPIPWLLAGGLTPDTVAEAIETSGAGAVDVSSGVETGPGRKDPAKIKAFVAAARLTQPAECPSSSPRGPCARGPVDL